MLTYLLLFLIRDNQGETTMNDLAKESNQEEISTSILNTANANDLETTLELAKKNMELVKSIKKIALAATNRHDWVDQQGKPYLQSSGCEKIRPLFGISWEVEEYKHENEEDGHFSYTVIGTFLMSGQKISVMGARSTKDPFFKRYEKDRNGKVKLDELGNKVEQPKANLDKTDVKKAAYSNFIMQGIVRILGIRNLTYEELEEYTGLTPSNIASVDYNSKGKKADSNTGVPGAASEKQIGYLRKLLESVGLKGKEVAGINDLKILSREIKSSGELTSKEASVLIKHFAGDK